MEPTPAAIGCVQALVRAALAIETGGSPGPVVPERAEVADVVAAAARHRVTDLLHTHQGELGLGPDFVAALGAAHAQTVRNVGLQLLETARLLALFADAGIPVLVVKGLPLAVQSAGSVTARGQGDIDLFVDPASVEHAHQLLSVHGWQARRWGSAAPGTWAWRHLVSTFNEVAFDGCASTVDLHWRLDPTEGVLPDFAESWRRRAVAETDVVAIPTLDVSTAFLHSCQHAAKDDWRWLRSLVDVHRLARAPEVRALVAAPGRRHARAAHLWATLAVTDELLGLPEAVQLVVQRRLGGHRAQLRRAVRAQARPAVPHRPLPVVQSLRDLRYRLVESRTPRAVLLAFSATAVPAPSVEGIMDRTAWTAVPKLVVRRISWLVGRSLKWLAGVRIRERVAPDRPAPHPGSGPS